MAKPARLSLLTCYDVTTKCDACEQSFKISFSIVDNAVPAPKVGNVHKNVCTHKCSAHVTRVDAEVLRRRNDLPDIRIPF